MSADPSQPGLVRPAIRPTPLTRKTPVPSDIEIAQSATMKQIAAQTCFQTCEIQTNNIGMEVSLIKTIH